MGEERVFGHSGSAAGGGGPGGLRSAWDRAEWFVLMLLGLQRLSYLAPPLVSAVGGSYHHPGLNLGLLGATTAWNAALFWRAARKRWVAAWMAWVDVAWACLLTVAVITNSRHAVAHDHADWSGRYAQAAAALAGTVLMPTAVAAAAVAALVATQVAATLGSYGASGGVLAELAGRVNGIVWFAIVLGFAVRYLRRQANRLEEESAARLAAETRRAADLARHETQLAQHRALHDTALATLTAIARGGVDVDAEAVRRRCAADVDRIRRLLDSGDREGTLQERLREAVDAVEALGLRVHYRADPLPADPPPHVVEALGDAAREALNNVVAHADTGAVWLSVSREDGASVVRVVDRGLGFDAGAVPPGFGLRRSVAERMSGVGGTARVVSAPGEGTCVELTWRP